MSTLLHIGDGVSISEAIAAALAESIREEPNEAAKLYDAMFPCSYRHLKQNNTLICSCFACHWTLKDCGRCNDEKRNFMLVK
jgi:hypothetical protein